MVYNLKVVIQLNSGKWFEALKFCGSIDRIISIEGLSKLIH